MVAEILPPIPRRTLPKAALTLLQLLAAAAAAVALYWLSLRLLSATLAETGPYGALPAGVPMTMTPLVETAVSGLATLPLVALAALWLRDLGGAPVPRPLPALTRAVLGAWGWLLACLLLTAVLVALTVSFLASRPFFLPDAGNAWTLGHAWRLLLAHDLILLLLWLIAMPRALARLCGTTWRSLRPRGFGRLLGFYGIVALPVAADLAGQLLLADALLFLDPNAEPWRFLALLYAQALAVTLVTALALLAAWRLCRPPAAA